VDFAYEKYIKRLNELARIQESKDWFHIGAGARIDYKTLRKITP
jgi:hypothetical protein